MWCWRSPAATAFERANRYQYALLHCSRPSLLFLRSLPSIEPIYNVLKLIFACTGLACSSDCLSPCRSAPAEPRADSAGSRPSRHGNTSGLGWRRIFKTARAGTRIFAAGDRVPISASPISQRHGLDIISTFQIAAKPCHSAAIVAVTIVILALWVRPANGHAGRERRIRRHL